MVHLEATRPNGFGLSGNIPIDLRSESACSPTPLGQAIGQESVQPKGLAVRRPVPRRARDSVHAAIARRALGGEEQPHALRLLDERSLNNVFGLGGIKERASCETSPKRSAHTSSVTVRLAACSRPRPDFRIVKMPTPTIMRRCSPAVLGQHARAARDKDARLAVHKRQARWKEA